MSMATAIWILPSAGRAVGFSLKTSPADRAQSRSDTFVKGMFVGHYAVALAAKRFTPRTSMGLLFIAVQLLDIIWAPLILLGVEHARVVPGLLPASSLDLYDMPWTHGLVAALAWSWFTFRFSKNGVLGA